ncbi:helix-turn-helix domain-containing protein [Streptomyces sp. NPDC097727]|uniref:helix-turn-helix domain-containing protein n=1 Tax=Streptomyces sp. NPDC097727 TaxID=3366092 RepID=UPI0038018FF5
MAPGLRRRTPGLRREEVAQLSGVGVTWYTWLEQGVPSTPHHRSWTPWRALCDWTHLSTNTSTTWRWRPTPRADRPTR